MKKIIFSLLTLTLSAGVNAQIVYTDIPDGQPVGLDFNSDATYEFDITTSTNLGDYIEYSGTDNNIHAISAAEWDVPNFVAQGFTIDASNNWEGAGDCSTDAWGGGNATVVANTDQYMAVKFNLTGTNVYYGWVRVNINATGDVTYKDYAYNSTAGQTINAGDMGAVLVSGITITGQGGVSTITTQSGTLQMSASVLPTNAADMTYTWSVVNGSGTATISATGLLTATSAGDVVIRATANDASSTIGTITVTISNQSVGIFSTDINEVSFYPNPTSNVLNINFNNYKIEDVQLINNQGQVIVKLKTNGANNTELDMKDLNTGVYYLKLTSNDNSITKKIIKK